MEDFTHCILYVLFLDTLLAMSVLVLANQLVPLILDLLNVFLLLYFFLYYVHLLNFLLSRLSLSDLLHVLLFKNADLTLHADFLVTLLFLGLKFFIDFLLFVLKSLSEGAVSIAVRTSHLLNFDIQIILVVIMLALAFFLFILLFLHKLLIVLDNHVRQSFSSGIVMVSELLFEVSDPLHVIVIIVSGTDGTLLQQLLRVLLVFCDYRL